MWLKLKTKLRGDFALVLFANIFSYLIAFSGSIIYVRLLGKHDFGLYTFAFNIISLFLLVNGFGAASGILQYASTAKSEEERDSYLRFAFQGGTFFNLLISGLILAYALIMPLPIPQAKPILISMALFPVGRLYIDVFQAYLRASQQNQLQAKFSIINSSILLITNLVGVLCYKLYGLIYFTYLGYLIMFLYSRWKFDLPKLSLFAAKSPKVRAAEFISYSFFTTLANAFSGLLFVLDIIIISYVVKDPKLIAVYRVATIIPFAINFIPGLAVNFYYPEFAKNANNPQRIRQLSRSISRNMLFFSSFVSLLLIVAAKPLINVIFGPEYHESILPFQIISFGYWIIASFRTVNGNVLAALGKARLSFAITLLVLIVNLLVTYLMVLKYSINGAAVAILFMYVFSSLLGYGALKLVLRDLES